MVEGAVGRGRWGALARAVGAMIALLGGAGTIQPAWAGPA
jgi:hypothetical protein